MNEAEKETTYIFKGPIIASIILGFLLILFCLIISLLNEMLNPFLAVSLAFSIMFYLLIIVYKRYYIYSLLLPLILAPMYIYAFGGFFTHLFGRNTFGILNGYEHTPEWLIVLIPILILLHLFITSKVTISPETEVEISYEKNLECPPDGNKKYEFTINEAVSRFLRVWQIVLVLVWLCPIYAIFFEQRLELQFLDTYGREANDARIFAALLIFIAWTFVAVSSFIMPTHELPYLDIVLRRDYGVGKGDSEIRRKRRDMGVLISVIGMTILILLLLYRWPFGGVNA